MAGCSGDGKPSGYATALGQARVAPATTHPATNTPTFRLAVFLYTAEYFKKFLLHRMFYRTIHAGTSECLSGCNLHASFIGIKALARGSFAFANIIALTGSLAFMPSFAFVSLATEP